MSHAQYTWSSFCVSIGVNISSMVMTLWQLRNINLNLDVNVRVNDNAIVSYLSLTDVPKIFMSAGK